MIELVKKYSSFLKNVPTHLLQSDIGKGGALFKRSQKEILKEKFKKKEESLKKSVGVKTLKTQELSKLEAKIEKKRADLQKITQELSSMG